ncbi:MAG TPA: hypothetical protein VJ183_03875 [Chloroflexia bacterium]|nr:hypothetical protein [Chloroflexia bacterium]
MPGTLWLGEHTRSRHQLSLLFGLDDLRFTASYWYADADLYDLEERYGRDFMARLYFHIAAFTANTLVSLRPDTLDPGPYARFCTPEFWALWKAVVRGAWAQWRYENDQPDYLGPALHSGITHGPRNSPVRVQPGPVPVLSFCGGGKDSLVSLKLLERAGVPFDTLAYSSTVYGSARRQHDLIDSLLDVATGPTVVRRRVWAYDDLTDSPVLQLAGNHSSTCLTVAETPSSIFMALPLALQHGYTYLCLGHERSADTGNVVWDRTGEEVNHQWGKSHEAEVLLNSYVNEHLVENCQYFSILKPAYDVLIFNLLAEELSAVPYTHSCNLHKPWCARCPKCAYVWINYMAYLPTDVVSGMFAAHGNLLDIADNQLSFRQMLGLEAHTPFECIGQVGEVRLAFELCRRKGLDGEAMRAFVREVPSVDVGELLAHYLQVNDSLTTLPAIVRNEVLSQMRSTASRAMERIRFASYGA